MTTDDHNILPPHSWSQLPKIKNYKTAEEILSEFKFVCNSVSEKMAVMIVMEAYAKQWKNEKINHDPRTVHPRQNGKQI